jgi:hypothetical protein
MQNELVQVKRIQIREHKVMMLGTNPMLFFGACCQTIYGSVHPELLSVQMGLSQARLVSQARLPGRVPLPTECP